MTGREAGQVDIREGDRVAAPRSLAGRPAGQVGKRQAKRPLGALGLLERRLVEEEVAEVPAPLAVARRAAGLHLDHQEASVGVDDHEVRLAVAGRPQRPGPADPAHAGVEAKLGRQGLAHPRVDPDLGGARMRDRPPCDTPRMEIDVALVPQVARTAGADALIVIDQIRASTTITTLLDLGCSDLIVTGALAAARRLGRETDSLLVGERHARRPPGFDYDNSPSILSRAPIRGRSVVLSTTNGTAMLRRVRRADRVLVGCIRNARACAEAAVGLVEAAGGGTGVLRVICSGREGRFVLEDAIAAGVIVGRAVEALGARGVEARLTDAAKAAVRLCYSYPNLLTAMQRSDGGNTLREIRQEDDIPYCAEEDASTTVPILRDGSPMRVVRLGA